MGSVLTQDGFLTEVCASMAECCQKIPRGTGALLLTEEAFEEDKVAPLLEILAAQPPWSDLPMIVLNRPGEARQPALLRVMGSAVGRLTLLERPMHRATLLNSLHVALRSRRRQYQVRDLIEEQQRNQRELAEREQRLRLATQTGKVGLWDWDIVANRISWTDSLYSIHGVNPAEFTGTVEGYMSLVHPEDRDFVSQTIQSALKDHVPYELEFRAIQPGGEVIWLFTNAVVLRDGGRPSRMLGATLDITQRRRTAEALHARIRELSLIYRNVSDAIYYLATESDERFRFLSVNPSFLAATGLSEKQVFGKLVQEVIREPSSSRMIEHYQKAIQERGTVHWEEASQYPSGKRVGLISVTPLFDANGKCINLIGTVHDITERKRAEHATRLLAAIVESSEDAIVSKDLNGIITTWNKGAERLFGYTAEEIIGLPVTTLIPAALFDEEPSILQRIWCGEPVEHFETTRRRKDGTLVDVSLTISPIKDEQGNIIGASKIARDITARKAAERRLNQTTLELKEAQRQLQEYAADLEQKVQQRTAKLTEAMGELESWSYSIAHDMRAPLRAMEGFSTILRVDYGSQLDTTGQDYLMRIAAAAERLDRFIQDLLNYGAMGREDLPIEPIDTERLIHQILDSYPNLQPAKADIQIQPPLPGVRANRPALTQVISNLLGNAVKFVKPGTRPQVRVWAEEEKDWTYLWFEDNGIGIEKESQQKIFQMFHRLNRSESYEGTGMGLAIVNKAVRRMGGTVGVESEPGHGSRFWVRLPNCASCDQASAESGEPTRPSHAEPQHRS